ncbi:hypothetical protein F2Q70_00044895 [Brassica cretica]|uniref:RNase H type-1 domain-containing protein n=1 Tax=Brassica cretica TaxID=69181 RepID=A0A8S9KP91_BRACR|nr:hypothetical protein F2Q70_00044895 [Brassica cretica]
MHVSSPLLAEALAIREALQQAISLKFTHIWIRSDSQVLVRAIDRNRSSSELHGVLSEGAITTDAFNKACFARASASLLFVRRIQEIEKKSKAEDKLIISARMPYSSEIGDPIFREHLRGGGSQIDSAGSACLG